jgi:hypothetical protein
MPGLTYHFVTESLKGWSLPSNVPMRATPSPQIPISRVTCIPRLEVRDGNGPDRDSDDGGNERGPGSRSLTQMARLWGRSAFLMLYGSWGFLIWVA